MSKKLIAVASAAALALSALVGVAPAMAVASFSFIDGDNGEAATAGDPATTFVPFENALDPGAFQGVEFEIIALNTGDVVRVTSTGSVKLMEAAQASSANVAINSLGSQSITKTRTSASDLQLFAYTTSTTAGTIKVEVTSANSTSSSTKYLKGVAGAEYNIIDVVGVPGTMAAAVVADVTFKITDVFGNAVGAGPTVTGTGGFASIGYDAATKLWEAVLTNAAGTNVFIAKLDIGAVDEDGLPDAKGVYTAVINSAAAAAANTALTAQVAALTAQLANSRGKDVSVTKKKYNNLAKRWNSAFPGQKVALKQ